MQIIKTILYILFFTLNIITVVESAEPCKPSVSINCLQPNQKLRREEGFCAGTGIPTVSGYRHIEDLVVGDYIIDINNQERQIVNIARKFVPEYVQLIIGNTVINAGHDQCFYVSPEINWVEADYISAQDVILNNNNQYAIDKIKIIHEEALLYVLAVNNHIFCIAPHNLIVHNSNAMMLDGIDVCLGSITVSNPVVALLGAAVALSKIFYDAYNDNQVDCIKASALADLLLAERYYYERRKTELEQLKQNFNQIKNGLESIKTLCSSQTANFTYLFLQQKIEPHVQNSYLKILIADEMQLLDDQKKKLRDLRELDLYMLEEEIKDIQLILALHCNEIMKQMQDVINEHKKITAQSEHVHAAWNGNLHQITKFIAFPLYEQSRLEEFSVNVVSQKFNEFKFTAQYYKNCMSSSCIKQTTNIIEALEKSAPLIVEYEQWLAIEKERIAYNISLVEQYYSGYGVSIMQLNAAIEGNLHKLNKQYSEKKQKKLIEINKKKFDLKNSRGPKKPRNNDDYPNMYEVFKKAIVGKILKDSSECTRFSYKGVSKIFRVIKDIEEYGIKRGDWFYLDKMHGDHIEVFCHRGKPLRTILNMDGTQNLTKIEQAGKRTIEKWIK